MSESVDFYTQGGQMIASGHTLTWVFWWDEDANPSNYQAFGSPLRILLITTTLFLLCP